MPLRIGLPILLLLLLGGCDREESSGRDAARSAEATRQLIAADAAARRDMADADRVLTNERSEIGRQRDALEQERKELAQERRRAPVIAETVRGALLLLLCALPLVLSWFLLRTARDETGSTELEDLLILEVSGEESLLAPAPRLAAPADRPRLPGDGDPPESPAASDSESLFG